MTELCPAPVTLLGTKNPSFSHLVYYYSGKSISRLASECVCAHQSDSADLAQVQMDRFKKFYQTGERKHTH